MKRLFCFALALALLAPAAWAQTTNPSTQPSGADARGPGGRGGGGQRMMQRFRETLEELKLTDEQRTQIEETLEQAREDMQALRQELADAEPQERFQRMREEMQAVQDDISNILTEEQRATFQKRIEEMRQG